MDWRWIYFRYFVQPTESGWGVCDSREYDRVVLTSAEQDTFYQSILYRYKPVGELPLVEALERATSLNMAEITVST